VDIKSTAERYPTGGSERASSRQLQNQNWIWILKHVDIADDVFLKWSIHVRLHKNNTNIEGERRLEDGDRAKDYSGASQSRKAATQAYEL
jgi:hypothetical protein